MRHVDLATRSAGARPWLALAVLVLACEALPLHAQQQTTPAFPPLVRIDAALGVGILKSPDGSFKALKRGDTVAGGAITRVLQDRIEIVVPAAQGEEPGRYWLYASADGKSQVSRLKLQGEAAVTVPRVVTFDAKSESR